MKHRQDLLSSTRKRNTSVAARRFRATLQRVLPLVVLAIGALGTPWLLISTGGTSRLTQLEREREEVELEISRLSKRVHELRARTQAVRSDPREVERVARDKLGLVRQTEVIFQFEPAAAR
jgi:cell division protein FtsB